MEIDVRDAEEGKFVTLLHLLIEKTSCTWTYLRNEISCRFVSADFNRTNLAMAEPTRSGWTPLVLKIIWSKEKMTKKGKPKRFKHDVLKDKNLVHSRLFKLRLSIFKRLSSTSFIRLEKVICLLSVYTLLCLWFDFIWLLFFVCTSFLMLTKAMFINVERLGKKNRDKPEEPGHLVRGDHSGEEPGKRFWGEKPTKREEIEKSN